MTKTAIRDDIALLPSPAEMEARLLYRDASLLILNKPAGIAVHVTAHDKVALDRAFGALSFGLPRPPALAHRLDRETSGCLVLGRHRQALEKLGKLFAGQQVEKAYLALVVGRPAEDAGTISEPLLKTGQGSKWRMVLDVSGQEAVTDYRRLAGDGDISLLALFPKTGRTHQLRLHCMALGCPVIGDKFYGVEEGPLSAKSSPLLLHAAKVAIPFYPKKPPIKAEAPLPPTMLPWLTRLGVVLAADGRIAAW